MRQKHVPSTRPELISHPSFHKSNMSYCSAGSATQLPVLNECGVAMTCELRLLSHVCFWPLPPIFPSGLV